MYELVRGACKFSAVGVCVLVANHTSCNCALNIDSGDVEAVHCMLIQVMVEVTALYNSVQVIR